MIEFLPPSVSTVVIDGQGFERGLDLLAEAGAEVLEPAFIDGYIPFDEDTFTEANAARVAKALKASGLSVRAVSAHIDLGQDDSLERLRRRLTFTAALGARILISNATTTDRKDRMAAVLDKALGDFAAQDVILALENPGHGSEAILADGRHGAEVIAAFRHPHLRMNYDIGNAATYGARAGTAQEDLSAALAVSAHLHLKDFRDVGGDWQFCAVGEGEVGYGTDVALRRIPRHIPIGLEHPIRLWRPAHGDPVRRKDIPAPQDVVAAIRRALAFVTAARAGSAPSD